MSQKSFKVTMFQLTRNDLHEIAVNESLTNLTSQIVISSGHGGQRYLPYAQRAINEEAAAQLEAISLALAELQAKPEPKPMNQVGFNSPIYDDYKK